MQSGLTCLSGTALFTFAACGPAEVRRRVEHELDRRAVRALVRRILADGRRPAEARAVPAGGGAPAAA